ncbi:aminotransferase [Homalodisca vitripennis]|nr:aminotransferase [Homalodisca vitripennis]
MSRRWTDDRVCGHGCVHLHQGCLGSGECTGGRGSPPKPLDLSLEKKTLLEVNINSGDKLIIEEQGNVRPFSEDVSASALADRPCEEEVEPYVPWPVLLRKTIPGDDSCLFTSIGFILRGYVDAAVGANMRKLIAAEIAKDHDTYNEAFLGRPNADYCAWILKPESWGGLINLETPNQLAIKQLQLQLAKQQLTPTSCWTL